MAMPIDKAMYMVVRSEWEAVPPKYKFKTNRPLSIVILRYTKTDPCADEDACEEAVRQIQKTHMVNNAWPDILYNYLIGGDGRVYEGTGWKFTTIKEKDYGMHDFENCDIAYIGKTKDDVTPDMRWAARKLLEHSYALDQVKYKAEIIGDQDAVDLLYT